MSPEAEALDDLILGRGVKRGRHEIPAATLPLFLDRLAACGFVPTRVADVPIEVGVRVPAWLVRPPRVDFGTVFWEVFTDVKRLKLFASEVRSAKGDWEIQIRSGSAEMPWVGLALAETYDASRPVGMY